MPVNQALVDGLPRAAPRVRLGLRLALVVAVALGLAAGAKALWSMHQHAEREQLRARYEHARADLAKLMPAGVTAEVCGYPCGISKLNPSQMAVQIERALPASEIVERGGGPGCRAIFCEARVAGRFEGFEAEGVASWHMLVLPANETPPRGAIAFRPQTHEHRHSNKRIYFFGSHVQLLLREPKGLRREEEEE